MNKVTGVKTEKQIKEYASTLLREAEHLSNIINTTVYEDEFFQSYDRIILIFEELSKYEHYDIFLHQTPSKNLKEIKKLRKKATKNFYERKEKYLLADTSSRNFTNDEIQDIYFSSRVYDIDAGFTNAGQLATDKGYLSLFSVMLFCKNPLEISIKLIKQLEAFQVIEKKLLLLPHKALMTPSDFSKLVYLISESEVAWGKPKYSSNVPYYDSMDGHQFEYFCAELLEKSGFINVDVTPGSGDHGVDILAEKDDVTYAIQCKCYSSNIGNAAVQQALTGKKFYHRDIAVVLTNQYFTPQAKEEATALGVKLWDRDKLNEIIEKSRI